MAASMTSSVKEATSRNKDKITVTLSSRSPSSISERRLVLTRDVPSVPIGRSSKIHSKGFVPAIDNAWFENPVMSRQHAELFAKFDEDSSTSVYIKDAGSFHGSFHTPNDGLHTEQRISPNEPVKLANGDIIRFGIDIFRSTGTFPPCSVDFLMEEMEEPTEKPNHFINRGFTVPDDMDDEDDEDYEDEEDVTVTAAVTKSTPAISEYQSTISFWEHRRPPIDLTVDGDDVPSANIKISTGSTSHGNMSSDVIDLTSEPDHQSDVEPNVVVSGTPTLPALIPIVSSIPASPRPTGSGVHTRFVHNPAGEIFLPSSPSSYSDDMYDDESNDEDHESVVSTDSELESHVSLDSTNQMSDSDEHSEEHESVFSELGDEYGASDSFEEENEESKHGCPTLTPEVVSDNNGTVLDLNQDPYFDNSDASSSTHDVSYEVDDAAIATISASAHKLLTDKLAHDESALVSVAPPFDLPPLKRMSPLRPFATTNSSHVRDPSPSDAALFKRRPILDHIPNENRAQILGEKSGKLEFFAAREKNRAAVNQHNSTVPTSAIRETLLSIRTDGNNGSDLLAITVDTSRSSSPSLSGVPDSESMPAGTEDNAAQNSSEAPNASLIKFGSSNMSQFSAWSISGDRFINNPRTEDLPALQMVRVQTPDLDMTSAYTFQQSKLATDSHDGHNVRRLPIQDLLAQEPKDCSLVGQPTPQLPPLEAGRDHSTVGASISIKRSFEEAFNQPADSYSYSCPSGNDMGSPQLIETLNQSRNPQIVPNVSAAQDTTDQAGPNMGEHCRSAEQSNIISTQPEDARPSKRLRLAQAAACVALGGAAAFSFLVNTAPVF
ncbi:hypothetical protein F5Y19DRAFT_247539 [Xylariaceae sp. FL1651]|nr:hypothetical protein F5Y19DRAFT_247539 [Xylariaceae sp. FL1651]